MQFNEPLLREWRCNIKRAALESGNLPFLILIKMTNDKIIDDNIAAYWLGGKLSDHNRSFTEIRLYAKVSSVLALEGNDSWKSIAVVYLYSFTDGITHNGTDDPVKLAEAVVEWWNGLTVDIDEWYKQALSVVHYGGSNAQACQKDCPTSRQETDSPSTQ